MKKNQTLVWEPLTKKQIWATPVLTVNEVESIAPDKKPKKLTTLSAPNWVITIPIVTGKDGIEYFLMVKQWRHGSACISVEFPGGVVDEGENTETAAQRELLEETGRKARSITLLAQVFPNPAIMENKSFIYLAHCDAEVHNQTLDEDEFVAVEMITVTELLKKMGTPPYDHALMCTALFFYMQHEGMLLK